MEHITIPKELRDTVLFVLAVVAGSGGIMYWVDRWRERVRLVARILRIDDTFFEFEVENLGKSACSLNHRLTAVGYQSSGGRFRRTKHSFTVNTPERELPAGSPKRFSAFKEKTDSDIAADEAHFVLVLPRYDISPSHGGSARPRGLLHSRRFSLEGRDSLPHIGALRYWFHVLQLLSRGQLPGEVEECVAKVKGGLTSGCS